MVKIEDLRKSLNPNLDITRKSRFEVAFRSLGCQDDYCRYHYDEFNKQHKLFLAAIRGKLADEEIQNPQYFRMAFEANCFAFFRSFHALIESIPYLLNLLIEVDENSESPNISWGSFLKEQVSNKYPDGVKKIKALRATCSYVELKEITNISKHRRIVRIDSGVFSLGKNASFCADDFDFKFRNYEINELMKTIYDDLHPQVLDLINSFLR